MDRPTDAPQPGIAPAAPDPAAAIVPVWADPRVRRGVARLLDARASELASGARHRGWKVALNDPAAIARAGVSAPLVGHLTDRSLLLPGAVVSDRLAAPKVEAEIAVTMGSVLPPGADADTVRAAIRGVRPALEVIDFDPTLFGDVELLVAGNIFHRFVVLGPAADESPLDILDEVRVNLAGAAAGTHVPVPGIVPIVAHVAGFLGGCGLELGAGDTIVTGAIGPAVAAPPGEPVAFDFGSLGSLAVTVAG
jgi:2-keto-4-pentenoate hydratase